MRKGVREIIERLLEEDPKCRDNDKWLTYRVFEIIAHKNGERIFIPFNLFNKFPAFETVKRTRAKIQNEEKRFLPKDEILIKRGKELEGVDYSRSMYANSQLT